MKKLEWNYSKANTKLISRAINEFGWENLFCDKNINEQLNLFNIVILDIFKNFIPNRVISCDDRDPPWINDNIKHLIKCQKNVLENYVKNGRRREDYNILLNTGQELTDLIKIRKSEYFSHLSGKLNNPMTSSKAYWSILKSFVQGKRFQSYHLYL